jgi:membrane-associated phospholipid phosphatase
MGGADAVAKRKLIFFSALWWAVLLVLLFATPYDVHLARWVAAQPQDFRDVFAMLSQPGDSAYYLWPSGLTLLALWLARHRLQPRFPAAPFTRWRWMAGYVFVSVALSGIAANIFKFLLGRPRPRHLIESDTTAWDFFASAGSWHSFPSGHTTTAATVAVCGWLLSGRRYAGLWLLLVVVVATSRVFSNAHYSTDVMAGAFLGAAVAYGFWLYTTRTTNPLLRNSGF